MRAALRHRRGQAVALVLLAALVAACAAFAPTYARSVDQAVLRSLVERGDSQATTTHISRTRTRTEPEVLPDEVVAALPPSLLALSQAPVAGVRYAEHVVPTAGKRASPVVLRSRSGMCEHLEVEGRCPSAPGELLVSVADARAWGWQDGTTLHIPQAKHDRFEADRPEVELTVVGRYTVADDDAGYWTGNRPDGKSGVPQPDLDNLPGIDDLLTPTSTFEGDFPTATVTVDLPLDHGQVTLDTLPAAVDGVAAMRSEHPELTVDQPLTRRLTELRAGQAQTAVIVPLVMTQLALLAVVALYLVARGAVDQRRPDLALARLRGRSGGAARRLVLAELGTCALVGVPVGAVAGVLLAWAVAGATLPTVPRELPLAVLWWTLGALVVSAGTVLLASRGVHREPVTDLLRAPRPRRGMGLTEILAGLLALAVVAGVALGAVTGPVALIAPVLTAVGASLLAAALLPSLAALLGTRSARQGAAVRTLVAGGVGRRPGPRRVLVASSVGVALAVFATTCVVVADGNRLARAELETGAPAAVTVSIAGPRQLLELADTIRGEGIAVSPVVTIAPTDPSAPQTIAVDPETLAEVAHPGALRGIPLAEVATPTQESIVLSGRRLTGTVSGSLDGLDEGASARVRMALTTSSGETVTRDLTTLEGGRPAGDAEAVRARPFVASTLCPGECRVDRIVVDLVTPPAQQDLETVTGTLTLADLALDGRPLDVGGQSSWVTTPTPDAELIVDEAGRSAISFTLRSAGGADGAVAVADVPTPLSAVLTPGVEGPVDPDLIEVVTPAGLQTEVVRRSVVDVLPRVTDRGVLVGLPTLARLGGGFDDRARAQLWFADPAAASSPEVRAAAEAAGVPLRSVVTTAEVERAYDDSASGWGLRLAALAGGVGLLLAALVAVVTAVTGWRQVVRDGAALLLSGVSTRTVRAAVRIEQLVIGVLALVLGTLAGLVGARIALPSVPLFADGVLVPEPSTAIPWGPVALTVLGSAVVLLGVALAVGRALAARTRPAAAREVT